MNNFITNVSRFDIITGQHEDAGPNSLLIQISDLLSEHPTPKYSFKKTAQFRFEDIEEDEEWAISDEQATAIAELLLEAKANNMNVIVHCHAGLCRSGAVVEAAVMLGFNDPEKLRIPNTLVKRKLLQALGMQISENTSVFREEFPA